MELFKDVFNKDTLQKVLAVVLFLGLIYLFYGMFNILLLTFFLTFLLYTIQNVVFVNLRKIIKVERNIITAVIFAAIILLMIFIMYKYVPIIIFELNAVIRQVGDFNINYLDGVVNDHILRIIKDIDVESYLRDSTDTALRALTNIGKWGFDFFVAFILSFFFIIEKDEILNFCRRLSTSRISAAYGGISYFTKSFINSFAKVMEAQIIIATVNSILSIIGLYFMNFPQVLGLGFMIFVLGLVPVAGVWVSLIPLSIIAFKIGGFKVVVYVLVMIAVIHSIEAYVLNPKIMSMNTKLPVFLTFLILLVSEHIMGIWGLLFGIPIFIFAMDILDIKTIKPKK